MTDQLQQIFEDISATIGGIPVALHLHLFHNGGGYGRWSGWCVGPKALLAHSSFKTESKEVLVFSPTEITYIDDENCLIRFDGNGQPPMELRERLPDPVEVPKNPNADLIKLDDAPSFRITCLKCGSSQTEFSDSRAMGGSGTGPYGSLDLVCKDCNNYQTIEEL